MMFCTWIWLAHTWFEIYQSLGTITTPVRATQDNSLHRGACSAVCPIFKKGHPSVYTYCCINLLLDVLSGPLKLLLHLNGKLPLIQDFTLRQLSHVSEIDNIVVISKEIHVTDLRISSACWQCAHQTLTYSFNNMVNFAQHSDVIDRRMHCHTISLWYKIIQLFVGYFENIL